MKRFLLIVYVFICLIVLSSCEAVNNIGDFIEMSELNEADFYLTESILTNNVQGIREAIKAGANVNKIDGRSGDDSIPVLLATKHNKVDILKVLLDEGADPNTVNSDGMTLLMIYSYNSWLEACECLIQYNPDMNIENSNGKSALDYAVTSRFYDDMRLKVVELLIENGAVMSPDVFEMAQSGYGSKGSTYIGIGQYSLTSYLYRLLIDQGDEIPLSEVAELALNGETKKLNDELLRKRLFSLSKKEIEQTLFFSAAFGGTSTLDILAKDYDMDLMNCVDSNARNLLHISSMNGNTEVVKYLLDLGMDINKMDGINQETSVMLAAKNGSVDTVKLLIEHGANTDILFFTGEVIEDETEYILGNDVLYSAVESNDFETFKYLWDNVGNVVESRKMVVTIKALQNNNEQVLRYMLNDEVDVNQTYNGDSLLDWCDLKESHIIIEEFGGDVDGANGKGYLLWWSASHNSELLEYLLVNGASFEGELSRKALNRSISYGNLKNVELLLGYDVDVLYSDINQLSALCLASGCTSIDILKVLLDTGTDPNAIDFSGTTPLIEACKVNMLKNVELLLQYGADKSITDNEGKTAMDYAVERNYEEVVALLEVYE